MMTHLEHILMRTYSLVQTLQSWLAVPGKSSKGILLANYTQIDEGLQWSDAEFEKLQVDVMIPQYNAANQSNRSLQILFIYLEAIFLVFFQVIFYRRFINESLGENKKFLKLLQLIPISTLGKNN